MVDLNCVGTEDLHDVSKKSLKIDPSLLICNGFDTSSISLLVYWELSDGDGCYEAVTVRSNSESEWREITQTNVCSCAGPPCFINEYQFAVVNLERTYISIKCMKNEIIDHIDQPFSISWNNGIFPGGGEGKVIIRNDDNALLFCVRSNTVSGEVYVPEMTNAVWTDDSSKVAILCKYGVVVADSQMKPLLSVSEKVKIWSGTWDASPSGGSANELFVYNTLHQLKYCIVACEEFGTLQPLDEPIYAVKVIKDKLFGISRDGIPQVISINTTEALYKLYVFKNKVCIRYSI